MERSTRSSSPVFACLVLVGSLTVAGNVTAQTRRSLTRRVEAVQIRLLEVEVPVRVELGRKFVAGLTEKNFELYEDGKREKIGRFVAPPPFPLRIAILTDVDPPFDRRFGQDLVEATVRPRGADSGLHLNHDFTRRYKGVLDDIYHVIEETLSMDHGPGVRQILIVLSQGRDAGSERSLKDTIEAAQRNGVTVFVISTKGFIDPDRPTFDLVDRELRSLCENTGGEFFVAFDKASLFRAFGSVEQTLRPEYTIYYNPQNQEETRRSRSIKITLIQVEGQAFYKHGYVY